MLNLLELEQLAAFAAEGTLSKAAEKLHISQPTITRTMQHLEEDFGVSLFRRTKNHIALNETGWKAVEYAERILKSAEEAVEGVRSFDRSLHTITVSSCAPAPLWELLPALTRTFPDMTISSSIKGNGAVLKDLQSGSAGCSWSAASGYGAPGILQHFSVKRRPLCVPACHPCTCRI